MIRFYSFKRSFLAVLLGCLSLLTVKAEMITGIWHSSHENFAQISILEEGRHFKIQAFRRCEAGYCSWSETVLENNVASFRSASALIDMEIQNRGNTLEALVVIQRFDQHGAHYEESQIIFERIEQAMPTRASSHANGVIFGQATGPAKQAASIFDVSLYGPDSEEHLLAVQSLHRGFQFDHLEDGLYYLHINPTNGSAVMVKSDLILIRIEKGRQYKVDPELY